MTTNGQATRHDTLVIVGSGPIGMVSALLLRNHFERVVVFERQSKERFLTTRGFTFPIVLSPAAIRVLQRVDAWEMIARERSPYFGVVIHKRLLGRNLTWTARRDGVYSHWRNHIIASLYERMLDEGVQVHFEAQVEDIDFEHNLCRVTGLGDLRFDLLLGADGITSQTRNLLADAHPDFNHNEFRSTLLDRWYAYRLPSVGALGRRFDGGDEHLALHVHVDNLADHPNEKFRVITVAMEEPRAEISVVIKHAADLTHEQLRHMNDAFFGPLVDADVLDREWRDGVGGKYEHVHAPTFRLNSTLLVGDAAHGFEGNGDLINLGISSVNSLPELLDIHPDIRQALAAYDATTGKSLRAYSRFAMRRSLEKINVEVAAFELGSLLRLNGHHPSLWGIYEDDFEISRYMRRYGRDRRRLSLSAAAVSAALVVTGVVRHRLPA